MAPPSGAQALWLKAYRETRAHHALDATFHGLTARIQSHCGLLARQLAVLVRLWLEKLALETSSVTWKRNRNAHARLLLRQLESGRLEAPFNRRPAQGPLSPLPQHAVYTAGSGPLLLESGRGGKHGEAPTPLWPPLDATSASDALDAYLEECQGRSEEENEKSTLGLHRAENAGDRPTVPSTPCDPSLLPGTRIPLRASPQTYDWPALEEEGARRGGLVLASALAAHEARGRDLELRLTLAEERLREAERAREEERARRLEAEAKKSEAERQRPRSQAEEESVERDAMESAEVVSTAAESECPQGSRGRDSPASGIQPAAPLPESTIQPAAPSPAAPLFEPPGRDILPSPLFSRVHLHTAPPHRRLQRPAAHSPRRLERAELLRFLDALEARLLPAGLEKLPGSGGAESSNEDLRQTLDEFERRTGELWTAAKARGDKESAPSSAASVPPLKLTPLFHSAAPLLPRRRRGSSPSPTQALRACVDRACGEWEVGDREGSQGAPPSIAISPASLADLPSRRSLRDQHRRPPSIALRPTAKSAAAAAAVDAKLGRTTGRGEEASGEKLATPASSSPSPPAPSSSAPSFAFQGSSTRSDLAYATPLRFGERPPSVHANATFSSRSRASPTVSWAPLAALQLSPATAGPHVPPPALLQPEEGMPRKLDAVGSRTKLGVSGSRLDHSFFPSPPSAYETPHASFKHPPRDELATRRRTAELLGSISARLRRADGARPSV